MQYDAEGQARRVKRMAFVDSLPADVRAIVHEEGLTIVKAFWDCGMRKARHIRHCIDTVRSEQVYGNPRPHDTVMRWEHDRRGSA